MKLLNLGCGYPRILEPDWINLDNLHGHLFKGTTERANLDAEPNYVNHEVMSGPLPFADGSLDGILASHFFEHFDAQEGIKIMRECRRVLMPGGILMVSVPDASYFRQVHPEDRKENWERLFDHRDTNLPHQTFFDLALWFHEHKAILTRDALWAYFTQAKFHLPFEGQDGYGMSNPIVAALSVHLNRQRFSALMIGLKPVE